MKITDIILEAAPAAPTQQPAQPAQANPQQAMLDKLGARAGAAAGSNIDQVTDAYQQKLLDRMGKRFGLPPGSSMEQVQAAQQEYLNKNDPQAAAQYQQQMSNIDAGKEAGPAVNLTQQPAATQQAPQAAPQANPDEAGGMAAAKAGKSPIAIMLAQPTIAGNQAYLDVIAPSVGLKPGATAEQILAADTQRNNQAGNKYAQKQAAPVAEGRATDSKGRTQQEWIKAVIKAYPDARIVQAKMIDGPCHAMLSNGKKLSWNKVVGLEEARKANTKKARAEFSKRTSKPKLSDKEQAKKKSDSDEAWERLMAHIEAQKKDKDLAEDKDPCWLDYKQVGMKEKNGKKVPNCVPKEGMAEGSEEGSYSDKFVQSQIDYHRKHGLSGTAADRERINGSLNYYQHIKNKRIKDGTWQEQRVAEGWDPDTTRLEQDVRDALENGDDYTAKQYAKMAPTPEAKKYLLNIIKQAMYIDDLGGETDWKGVTEAGEWTKLPNGNWRNMHTGAQQSTPPKTKKPRRTMGLHASLEQHADDKMKELGHKFRPVAEDEAGTKGFRVTWSEAGSDKHTSGLLLKPGAIEHAKMLKKKPGTSNVKIVPYRQVSEMDGNGSGRDGSNRKRISSYGTRDRDISGPDIHLGAKNTMKRKDIVKRAASTLNKAFKTSKK